MHIVNFDLNRCIAKFILLQRELSFEFDQANFGLSCAFNKIRVRRKSDLSRDFGNLCVLEILSLDS